MSKEFAPEGLDFPTEATMEGAEMSELIWFIYGSPGIGKSTFFSKFKGALFLYTDPGQRFIKAKKHPILSWLQFKKYVDKLMTEKPDYSMIVLDTVDILFRMCRKYVCAKRNIEHQSDEAWGKGYDLVHDEFEQCIAKLSLLPYGLAFVSHSKEIEIRGRSIRTNKIVPTLPKQGHSIIAPLSDIIGYCGYSTEKADVQEHGERLIQFSPDEALEAKDRTGLLPGKCALDFDIVSVHLKSLVKATVKPTVIKKNKIIIRRK